MSAKQWIEDSIKQTGKPVAQLVHFDDELHRALCLLPNTQPLIQQLPLSEPWGAHGGSPVLTSPSTIVVTRDGRLVSGYRTLTEFASPFWAPVIFGYPATGDAA